LAKASVNHCSTLGPAQDNVDSDIAMRTGPGSMAKTITPCPRVSAARFSLSRYNAVLLTT
jgi:hypothetical protein